MPNGSKPFQVCRRDGSFAVLELQLEQDFYLGADMESLSAVAELCRSWLRIWIPFTKRETTSSPVYARFKSVTVEPGNRLDDSAAIRLRFTTTTGASLIFGLERRLAAELYEARLTHFKTN